MTVLPDYSIVLPGCTRRTFGACLSTFCPSIPDGGVDAGTAVYVAAGILTIAFTGTWSGAVTFQ